MLNQNRPTHFLIKLARNCLKIGQELLQNLPKQAGITKILQINDQNLLFQLKKIISNNFKIFLKSKKWS